MLPFSWGMKGKTREVAQAEYELTGKMLALRLLEIDQDTYNEKVYNEKLLKIHFDFNDITEAEYNYGLAELIDDAYERRSTLLKLTTTTNDGYDLAKALLFIDLEFKKITHEQFDQKSLNIDFKYNKLSQAEFYRKSAELIKDDDTRKIAFLELDLQAGKIDKNKYDKDTATIKKQPWVAVLKMDFAAAKPEEGSFELDWNDYFVTSLKDAGYTGDTDDAIVNFWFMLVCKNIALEEFGGVGTFDDDVDANLASQPASVDIAGRKTHK